MSCFLRKDIFPIQVLKELLPFLILMRDIGAISQRQRKKVMKNPSFIKKRPKDSTNNQSYI